MSDREVKEKSEVPEPERTQVAKVVNIKLVRSEGSRRARAADGLLNKVWGERCEVVIQGAPVDLALKLAVGSSAGGGFPREELAESICNISPRGQGAVSESDRQIGR